MFDAVEECDGNVSIDTMAITTLAEEIDFPKPNGRSDGGA